MDDGYNKTFHVCFGWVEMMVTGRIANAVVFLKVCFGWVKLMIIGRIVLCPWSLSLSFCPLVRWLCKSYFTIAFGGDSSTLK